MTRWCYGCKGLKDPRTLASTSSVIGLSLEECCHFVTKGSKIEKLTLKADFSHEFIQGVRHLIDSSLSLHLVISEFVSTELLMNLVKEPRRLKLVVDNYELLKDEFFRSAGRYSFTIVGYGAWLSVTDEQLSILAERGDLTDIDIGYVEGITAEGIKRAIQNLLQSSPKRITMMIDRDDIDKDSLMEMPELDAETDESDEFDENFKYFFGDGKVKVVLNFYGRFCEIKMDSS